MQIKVRLDSRLTQRWAKHFSKQTLLRAARVMGPTLVALTFAGVARAQGTISFSGAQTFMQTVQTFAIYAGAVICFGGLIFAGIRMMSGRFQDAIPGLFGAGVLGWGAGWIGAPARSAGTGACRLLQRRLERGWAEGETHLAPRPKSAILD
jgi:hypothetical protein